MGVSLFFHTVGFVLWMGSLIIIPTFMKGVQNGVDSGAYIVRSIKKAILGYFLPGFGLTFLSGMHQINSTNFKQGWFHGKILCIIILLLSSMLLLMEYKKLLANGVINKKIISFIQISSSICLILIVLLMRIMRW